MANRYALRMDRPNSWTVFDVFTGQPAEIEQKLMVGIKTRRAIGRWQEENQLPPTTFLTPKQYARLKLDTDDAVKSYRAQRASEAEAKKQESATSQKKPQPVVRAKPRREQQREAANPRPVPKSKPAQRKSGYRTCSGIDGTFEVPASQRCPLSGYAHY